MRIKKILLLLSLILVVGGFYAVYPVFKKKQPEAPYLTVIGPVDMADGIGRQSAELIDILKDDVNVSFVPTRKIDISGINKELKKVLRKKTSKLGKVILYEECLGTNGENIYEILKTLKNDEQIRIAYSMFESSLIPKGWVYILNHYFDAVAVPDKFLLDVYKNSGVTIPVFEVPLGLNIDKFLNSPLKKERKKPFIFANFSTAVPRKNHVKLIQAFYKAFGNSPDVILRLNNRYGDYEVRRAIKDEIEKLHLTNVEYSEMPLDDNLYFKVFEEADCYVSISTGEGFSIQPREAMALGIPCIVTDNTGQSTICSSNLVRKVSSTIEIPGIFPCFNLTSGVYYDCALEEVVEALKDVYNNYDQYLQKGPEARKWVMQYRYPALKPLYLSLIKPQEVVLGNENKVTEDCLTTNSRELYEKYLKLKNNEL